MIFIDISKSHLWFFIEVTEDLPGWEDSALNAELAALKAQRRSPVRTSLADTVLDSADDIEAATHLAKRTE